jgi:hypothetical protein
VSSNAPKVGQIIYVPSALYIDHGEDDRQGGRAKVTKVTTAISAGKPTPFVTVEPFPATSFNWDVLAAEQAALRKEYGRRKARPDPDIRRPRKAGKKRGAR